MIRIVCVGNLKEKYWSEAANEYLKRISKYSKIEIIEFKESTLSPFPLALKEEEKEIIRHLKGFVIKLAIEGTMLDSETFATKLETIYSQGNSDITFLIGSSHGLSSTIPFHFALSFSKMTFPHQLSRILLLEQIYRAYSILNHTKYHK